MKKLLIILLSFFSLLPVCCPAADSPADSLRKAALKKHYALVRVAMTSNAVADWDTVIANARTQKDTVSICMGITNRLLCLFNKDSIGYFRSEAHQALPFLREARQFNYYFHTYQTYINSLFRSKLYDEAQQAATDMFDAAREENQPQGMAMALQVQGSMYYQLGLYPEAMQTLEKAFRICPPYAVQENNSLTAYSLICEWLCMTALKLNDTGKLSLYANHYADMVDYRYELCMPDAAGHYPVTATAFRAQALLKSGKAAEARALLDKGAVSIVPGISARAYEHYYEARCSLSIAEGNYKAALAAADTLLAAHKGYFPFCLHDMLRKAEILVHLGRASESTGLYSRYIEMKDSIERMEIAVQMDKIQTLYEVDRLKADKRNSFLGFLIAVGSCTLLFIIFISYFIYSRRLHRKNRILYLRFLEQEKMEERVFDAMEVLPVDNLSKEAQLFCRLSELMHGQKLFTNPNLKRKDLAELLNTNETYLANAVRINTEGKSYHEYITDLRLKHASRLLAENYELSITEVCEESGFNSSSTFFRVFRERFGMSPSDFRSISREK